MVRLFLNRTPAFFFFLMSLLPATALPARSPDLLWKIDMSRSFVRFKTKMLFQTVAGRFTRMNLESINFTGNPRSLKGRMSIEIDSLDTGNPKRDAHLKAEDFFWVERYPNAVVDVQDISEEKGQFIARIILEIRGIRKEFQAPIDLKADWMTIQGIGQLKLSRRDYGVRGNILTNTIISDKMLIEYAIVLVRK